MSILLTAGRVPKNGRTYVMPAVEDIASTASNTLNPLHVFQVRMRDTLDYTVDLSHFLGALGENVALATANFTVVGAISNKGTNVQAPLINGQTCTSEGRAIFILTPAPSAALGDLYTIEMVATTTEQTLEPNKVLPPRVITRRVALQVIPG